MCVIILCHCDCVSGLQPEQVFSWGGLCVHWAVHNKLHYVGAESMLA